MTINVSKKFHKDFFLCMEAWNCTTEEIEFEKKRAREAIEDAKNLFHSIASDIRLSRQFAPIERAQIEKNTGQLSGCGRFYHAKE